MEDRFEFVTNKISDITSLQRTIAGWRLKGDRVVFTNGCFDILHKGHVTYLAKAASLGERLVVALNTDDSVRRLGKDENRPINPEDARAVVLASLGFVDAIVFFNDDNLVTHFFSYKLCCFLVDHLVDGNHVTHLHHRFNNFSTFNSHT